MHREFFFFRTIMHFLFSSNFFFNRGLGIRTHRLAAVVISNNYPNTLLKTHKVRANENEFWAGLYFQSNAVAQTGLIKKKKCQHFFLIMFYWLYRANNMAQAESHHFWFLQIIIFSGLKLLVFFLDNSKMKIKVYDLTVCIIKL